MSKQNGAYIRTVILWTLNFLVVASLLWRTIDINNDKAPMFVIFYYGVLLLINLGLWISFTIANKDVKLDFKKISLTLLAAFIPLLTFVAFHE